MTKKLILQRQSEKKSKLDEHGISSTIYTHPKWDIRHMGQTIYHFILYHLYNSPLYIYVDNIHVTVHIYICTHTVCICIERSHISHSIYQSTLHLPILSQWLYKHIQHIVPQEVDIKQKTAHLVRWFSWY